MIAQFLDVKQQEQPLMGPNEPQGHEKDEEHEEFDGLTC